MQDPQKTRVTGRFWSPDKETDRIGEEFDADACDFCDRYKRRGLSKSSRLLLDFILDEGVQNRTVADLGSGAGGFSIELLKKGAASVIGVDLSSKMVEAASELEATTEKRNRCGPHDCRFHRSTRPRLGQVALPDGGLCLHHPSAEKRKSP